MWHMIPSLDGIVQALAPVFTHPSFTTQCQLLLGWVMCAGTHTSFRVGQTILADTTISNAERHPFDRYYNFFSRSEAVTFSQKPASPFLRWRRFFEIRTLLPPGELP
jgi:hypothetical protein